MQVPALISGADMVSESSDAKSIQTYLAAVRMYYFKNYQVRKLPIDVPTRVFALNYICTHLPI